MSSKYPRGYYHVHVPKQGTLSDWEKITTNAADGKPNVGDHAFTIPDLLQLIRTLREEFDPVRIAQVEELISRHISRTDNPHLVDLEKMNSSVMQELYKVWLEEGYVGTRDEFAKVLFQYIKIADIPTTLRGESYDEVVTPAGIKAIMDRHEHDPDAHSGLVQQLMPGDPIQATPTYSLQGSTNVMDISHEVSVSRNSPMWIINHTGVVEKIPANSLKADYSTGKAAFPVFQELTNLVEDSVNFDNTDYWYPEHCTVGQTYIYDNINNTARPTFYIKEKDTVDAKRHGISYVTDSIRITSGEYYTISAIVAPMGRQSVGIEVMDMMSFRNVFGFAGSGGLPFDQGTFYGSQSDEGSYRFAHFNMEKELVFVNKQSDGIYGYIYPLLNGTYRVQLTFKAARSLAVKFRIYTLDVYDGDQTHEGVDGLGVAVFGVTFTEGGFLPPYMISEAGTLGHIEKTVIKIPIDETWFRKETGTVIMQCNNNSVDRRLKDISELYSFANGGTNLAMFARQPVGHNNRVYMTFYGDNNAFLTSSWTEESKATWMTTLQGYSNVLHSFGGSAGDFNSVGVEEHINRNISHVYLGCDRYENSQLNGFISSFIYYPELLEEGNLEFFTYGEEEPIEYDYTGVYEIMFNGIWTPTAKFNEVFELVDDYGTVVLIANPSIHKYRFKEGKESYIGVTSLADMFKDCRVLTSIVIPYFGENMILTGMLHGCTNLSKVILEIPTDRWQGYVDVKDMFEIK